MHVIYRPPGGSAMWAAALWAAALLAAVGADTVSAALGAPVAPNNQAFWPGGLGGSQLDTMRQAWEAAAWGDMSNNNTDCHPVVIAKLLRVPSLSLRALRDGLAGHHLLFIGNSVTRNLYFTLKHLLTLAQTPADLDADVLFLVDLNQLRHAYRSEEKRLCTPTNPFTVPTCTARIGGTSLTMHWNTTGEVTAEYIRHERSEAVAEDMTFTLILAGTVMHPMSMSSVQDLEQSARRVVQSTRAALRSFPGTAMWLPAPMVCAAPPRAVRSHFSLPTLSPATLNERIDRYNGLVSAGLANSSILRLDHVRPPPRAHDDICVCYDDWVHHRRLSMLALSRMAFALLRQQGRNVDPPLEVPATWPWMWSKLLADLQLKLVRDSRGMEHHFVADTYRTLNEQRKFITNAYRSGDSNRAQLVESRDAVADGHRTQRRREHVTAADRECPDGRVPQSHRGTGLPEMEYSRLTGTLLRKLVRKHGGVIVRHVVGPDAVRALTGTIDGVYEKFGNSKYETNLHGVHSIRSPSAFEATLELYASVGLKKLLNEYFASEIVVSTEKMLFRRGNGVNLPSWHQDGRFMDTVPTDFLNVWLSLSHCGGSTGAPGLFVVPRGESEYVAPLFPNESGLLNILLNHTEITQRHPIAPVFQPGDALIFDKYLVHSTQFDDGRGDWTRIRHAIEMWVHPQCSVENSYSKQVLW